MISPEVAFQVSYLLQGVLDRGTAASARALGVSDPLAGKTGTTNAARDSWFVGYSPDRATLVWVGYDDNRGTRLSGNRAALPIWSRFVVARRPAGGYQADRGAGRASTSSRSTPRPEASPGRRCPTVIAEAFLDRDRARDRLLSACRRSPAARAERRGRGLAAAAAAVVASRRLQAAPRGIPPASSRPSPRRACRGASPGSRMPRP